MRRVALTILLSAASGSAVNISSDFFGTWTSVNHSAARTPLGLNGWLFKQFAMTKDESNGDVWFSAISGQVFRVRGNLMEYCFAHVAESPFSVESVEKHRLVFCYKKGLRMRTHKANSSGLVTGCDAAQLTIEILKNGNLEFTFLMSPPATHAWLVFERTGEAPPVQTYIKADFGGMCDPYHPGPPTYAVNPSAVSLSSMCPVLIHKKRAAQQTRSSVEDDAAVVCRQLNGDMLHATPKTDIQLQYTPPKAPCWPCRISYTVSAAIDDDQYIAVGFKGMAYRYYEDVEKIHPERPNYFGMSSDPLDEERTTSVIVLGYVHSNVGCVREMRADGYIGAVSDVAGNPSISDVSVERSNGRTVVRFSVEQHVGNTSSQIDLFYGVDFMADLKLQAARVMYAIGQIGAATSEGACKEQVQYHDGFRGVSPLSWFNQNQRCKAEVMIV